MCWFAQGPFTEYTPSSVVYTYIEYDTNALFQIHTVAVPGEPTMLVRLHNAIPIANTK